MTDPRSPDARRAYAGGVFVDGTPLAGGCAVRTARVAGESASSPQTNQGAFHDEDMPIHFAAIDPDLRRAD
jgi:hypothetical protein